MSTSIRRDHPRNGRVFTVAAVPISGNCPNLRRTSSEKLATWGARSYLVSGNRSCMVRSPSAEAGIDLAEVPVGSNQQHGVDEQHNVSAISTASTMRPPATLCPACAAPTRSCCVRLDRIAGNSPKVTMVMTVMPSVKASTRPSGVIASGCAICTVRINGAELAVRRPPARRRGGGPMPSERTVDADASPIPGSTRKARARRARRYAAQVSRRPSRRRWLLATRGEPPSARRLRRGGQECRSLHRSQSTRAVRHPRSWRGRGDPRRTGSIRASR